MHNTLHVRTQPLARLARVGLFTATLLGGLAFAQLESLRIMAPASPGGGWDGTSRLMQQVFEETGIAPGTEVFNVPGAGGTVGLAQLVSSERGADDLLMMMGLVMSGSVLTNQSVVTLEEVTPIARLMAEYEVIVVPEASEFQTLDDLLEALRADPGAVAWAGGSAGGTDHMLAGLVAQAAGVDPAGVNYVPFSGGGEALAAILGSQVAAGISTYSEWASQIETGELRVLAISSPERIEGIDVPTLIEQGIDVELANWRGVVAAPDLAEAQVAALTDAVDQMHESEEWQGVLADNNWEDFYLSGEPFAEFLTAEDERVTAILQDIGLVSE